jgi:hypothetical protein
MNSIILWFTSDHPIEYSCLLSRCILFKCIRKVIHKPPEFLVARFIALGRDRNRSGVGWQDNIGYTSEYLLAYMFHIFWFLYRNDRRADSEVG